jgi:hypothetical protein
LKHVSRAPRAVQGEGYHPARGRVPSRREPRGHRAQGPAQRVRAGRSAARFAPNRPSRSRGPTDWRPSGPSPWSTSSRARATRPTRRRTRASTSRGTRPRASTASAAPRSANPGSRGGKPSAHRGGTRTSPRPPRAAATSRSNPTGPTNRSRGGARASACTGPSTAATTSYSTAASRNRSSARRPHENRHPYVNIGARTTRAERGRQTLGRAQDERSQSLGASSPGPQAPRDVDGFKLGAVGRQIEARRTTEPRATVGTHSRSPRRRGNPRGSRAGTGRRRCGRTRASRARGRTTRLSISGDRRRAGGASLISVRRLIRRPRRRTGGLRLPGAGRRSRGSSGKGSPGAGRTYPVSGREVRARTMSGRWTPRDEARGPKKLLGRASPTP